jgi:hypothetical protein
MEDDIKRILQNKQFHLQLRAEGNNTKCVGKKSDSHKTWKCADPELEWQIRCFPYGERSDVTWLQQVEQKAIGRKWQWYEMVMVRNDLLRYICTS